MMRKFSPEELGEIRTLYRNAASPQKQIGILADLYACPKQDIERALGLPVTSKRVQKQPPKPRLRWTPEMEARLVALYAETHETAAIAGQMGLPPKNIKCKIEKLKVRGVIPRTPAALSGCAEEGSA
ncbi:MAG TPA: hypothetical protein H9745_06670 [Candidatus Agathobaculum stercoravium]|nr:hypothetical protein [Candidatus Agathobaculum stercoravium]